MRSIPTLLVLCLPLSLTAGCPSDDSADDGGASSTTNGDPTADSSSTTQTDPPPPDTDTDTTPPPDTDTDTDTDTDSDTDTNGRLTGCECILDENHVDDPATPASPTCGEALCASVVGSCGDAGCGEKGPFVLDDPAALECALTALRDRSPGIVTWSWSELIGQYDDAGYVLVNADGTAVRRNWSWNDLDYEASDAVLGELPPPAHFDACLAEPDDLARFDCLRGALDSSLEVCDEGWTYTDF